MKLGLFFILMIAFMLAGCLRPTVPPPGRPSLRAWTDRHPPGQHGLRGAGAIEIMMHRVRAATLE